MQCDMCGKLAPLAVAEIEGIELNVCSNCSGFGKVIRRLSSHPLKGHSESKRNMEMKKASDDEEIKEMIEPDVCEASGPGICVNRSKAGALTVREIKNA